MGSENQYGGIAFIAINTLNVASFDDTPQPLSFESYFTR